MFRYTMKLILVMIGGAVGSAARYGVGIWIAGLAPSARFPWATLAVNLTGCLLIGALYRLAEHLPLLDRDLRPLLFVGLLGGFTTFSTFGMEALQLGRGGAPNLAWIYVVSSIAGGVALTWIGHAVTDGILGAWPTASTTGSGR